MSGLGATRPAELANQGLLSPQIFSRDTSRDTLLSPELSPLPFTSQALGQGLSTTDVVPMYA